MNKPRLPAVEFPRMLLWRGRPVPYRRAVTQARRAAPGSFASAACRRPGGAARLRQGGLPPSDPPVWPANADGRARRVEGPGKNCVYFLGEAFAKNLCVGFRSPLRGAPKLGRTPPARCALTPPFRFPPL